MPGPILVLLAIFIVGPIALFVGGALLSAVMGWFLSDEADEDAAPADAAA